MCSRQNKEVTFLDTLKDCVLEQSVMQLSRKVMALDFILSGDQDSLQDVSVAELIENSGHSTIRANIYVS